MNVWARRRVLSPLLAVCTYTAVLIWHNYLNSISIDSSFTAEGDSRETASSLIPPLQIQLSLPCLSLRLLPFLSLSLRLAILLPLLAISLYFFYRHIPCHCSQWYTHTITPYVHPPLHFKAIHHFQEASGLKFFFLAIIMIDWSINQSIHRSINQSVHLNAFLYIFLYQISINEHLKQLTDAHRDFSLLHGEWNTLTHTYAYPHTSECWSVDKTLRLCGCEKEKRWHVWDKTRRPPPGSISLSQWLTISVSRRERKSLIVNRSLNNWRGEEGKRT